MVKVSVILPTYRIGGVDIAFEGLGNQTFTDYEVVMVDALYRNRRDLIFEYAEEKGVPLKYVPPHRDILPYDSVCIFRNSGLFHAEGELVIWFMDYTYAKPDWIERHWSNYDEAERVSSIAPHEYYLMPPTKPLPCPESLLPPLREEYHNLYISTFQDPFTKESLSSLTLQAYGQDPKRGMPRRFVSPNYFHAKNESVPLNVCLEINGWDENFDRSHGWDDLDFGYRAAKTGHRFIVDPKNKVYAISRDELRRVIPQLKWDSDRPINRNEGYYLRRRSSQEYRAPNEWEICEKRKSHIDNATKRGGKL